MFMSIAHNRLLVGVAVISFVDYKLNDYKMKYYKLNAYKLNYYKLITLQSKSSVHSAFVT